MIAATTSARGTARSPSPPRPDALGFQALFGDELFSLTPADLACYTYAMVNRQDVPYSQVSLEIGRPPLAAEIVFDGTKLAIERSRPKTTTDGRKLLFPALFDQPKNQNRARRSGRARQRSAALTLGAGLSPAVATAIEKSAQRIFFSASDRERKTVQGISRFTLRVQGSQPLPKEA